MRAPRLMTAKPRMYSKLGKEFAEHGTTLHGGRQYVDPNDRTIHTNTVEGAFSICAACGEFISTVASSTFTVTLAEFEFRYNTRSANGFDDRARAREELSRWNRRSPGSL